MTSVKQYARFKSQIFTASVMVETPNIFFVDSQRV